MCGGSTRIDPTVDGVSAQADTSAGCKSDGKYLAFEGVAGPFWTSRREGADKGNSQFIDTDLCDRRFSNRKPKTSAAGRNSDSVVSFGGGAGLSSEV